MGKRPYIEAGESLGLSRSGWAWDAKLDDFNNDGVMEAVQAVGFMKGRVNRLARNHELAMDNDALVHFPKVWPMMMPDAEHRRA